MNEKILFVEDDESLGFVTQDSLSHEGFEVDWAKNGEEAWRLYQKNQYEICILDVMMPRLDGFTLARSIRKKDEFIPILFLTARSEEEDRLKGFEIGGDDYISKPFSMKELVYRIGVFLRRYKVEKKDTSPNQEIIPIGRYLFDPNNHCLKMEDQKISLTYMESQLVKFLHDRKNQLARREEILEEIWGENDYFKGRSLDVFISRLRKYFRHDPHLEIRNHHGVGFTLLVTS